MRPMYSMATTKKLQGHSHRATKQLWVTTKTILLWNSAKYKTWQNSVKFGKKFRMLNSINKGALNWCSKTMLPNFQLIGTNNIIWLSYTKLYEAISIWVQLRILQRYWTFISFFYVLTCITSFRYLSITCNAFIACYSICNRIFNKH